MPVTFTHYDLGELETGCVIEVTLEGSAANVQLLEHGSYENFLAGKKEYRYIGGLVKKSPVRLRVPKDGRWHITVDLRGLAGTVKSSIRLFPASLPEMGK